MTQFEPSWSIILARQAETTLRRLPPASFRLLDRQISALAKNPRPLECQRLVGYGDLYRLRVSEWRIAYAVEDERRLVFILEIVPKQQPERYRLDLDEPDVKGEGGAPEGETMEQKFYQSLANNLTDEAQKRRFLDLASRIEALRHLIPDMNQPAALADLVRNLELLKKSASAQLEATTQTQSGQAAWYLLYCTSGSERKLKQRLLHRVQQFGLGHKVLQVVIPGETETEPDEAKAVQATPPSFYGIVLVEMVMGEEIWEIVRTTPGVSAYLGSDDRPTPLQPDQLDSLLRGTADIFRLSSPEEAPAQEKIRLCIRLDSLPIRQELYKIIGAEADLELIDEPTEADIILTETTMPKGVFSSNSPTESEESGPAEVSPELWPQADQTLVLVQDLANYLATPTGIREFLKVPFSIEELLQAVHRVYRLSLERNTMESALQAFKTAALGQWLEISLSVADLSQALIFYGKMGLRQVDGGQEPYPWAFVSDETLHLGLHQQPFPSPTLTYFSWGERVSNRVAILKKLNVTFDQITTRAAAYQLPTFNLTANAEFTSLEGQRICLANFWRDMRQPQRSFFVTSDKFGEFSLKTVDANRSVAYWEQLGFKRIAGSDKPYPWATLSDGLIRLGLHQTTRFTRPTISYFSPDMPDRLQRLREQDIPFRSEYKDAQGCTIGAVIHSPDGQPFFLFTGQPG